MHIDNQFIESLILAGAVEADKIFGQKHKQRKEKIFEDIKPLTVSPSSASIILRDEMGFRNLIGSCRRETWFRVTNLEPSNPPDLMGKYKMSMGKDIENTEQRYLSLGMNSIIADQDDIDPETTGFFENVLFYLEDAMFGVNLLGEMDGIFVVNGKPYPLEVKSIYGYYAIRDVFGNKSQPGRPKPNQFLQASLYVYALNNLDKLKLWTTAGDEAVEITDMIKEPATNGFMRYIDRSNGTTTTFELGLEVKPSLEKTETNYIPTVNGERYLPITIMDIFKSYKVSVDKIEQFKKYLNNEVDDYSIPARDSIFQYSDERLKWLANQKDTGLMNKKDREEYAKKGTIYKGDWNCIEKGTHVLIGDNNNNTKWIPIEDVTEDDYAMTRLGLQKITKTIRHEKQTRSDLMFVKPYNLLGYTATNDHEILIGTSNNYYNRKQKLISSTRFVPIKDIDKINDLIYTAFEIDRTIKDSTLDANDLRILGNFIAEGHFHKNEDGTTYKCGFTYNINEEQNAREIGELCLNRGATSYKINIVEDHRHTKVRRSLRLKVYGIEFVRWLKKYIIGEYSYNKQFTSEVTQLNTKKQNILLGAMIFCDGCHQYVRDSELIDYTTTSKILALQVQMMYFRNNKIASIVFVNDRNDMDGYSCRDIYHVRHFPNAEQNCGFIHKNIYYARLMSIESIPTKEVELYDLSVENTPEFLTQGGIVHNCRYCRFKDLCLGSNPYSNGFQYPSDDELKALVKQHLENQNVSK